MKSDHKLEVYLNLARRLRLTGIDQLWVADFTYIRLKTERTLASQVALAALEQAIATRKPAPGLVHHSDRGVQYWSPAHSAC
jgi:putative transposase